MKKPLLMRFASIFRIAMVAVSAVLAGWVSLRLFLPDATLLQGLWLSVVFFVLNGVLVALSFYLSVVMVPWSVQAPYTISQMRRPTNPNEPNKEN